MSCSDLIGTGGDGCDNDYAESSGPETVDILDGPKVVPGFPQSSGTILPAGTWISWVTLEFNTFDGLANSELNLKVTVDVPGLPSPLPLVGGTSPAGQNFLGTFDGLSNRTVMSFNMLLPSGAHTYAATIENVTGAPGDAILVNAVRIFSRLTCGPAGAGPE